MADAAEIWRTLQSAVNVTPRGPMDIDLTGASLVDGAVMALLAEIRAELIADGRRCEIVGVAPHVAPLVHLYGGDAQIEPLPHPRRPSLLESVGRKVAVGGGAVRRLLGFLGMLVISGGGAITRPRTANWRAIPELVARAGTDGLPIVLLLNFLSGLVMAYQSAHQLRLYGANVFVADVVGISLTRELGPLMTAFIVSGRSGASFAAEIGAMKVSEEIDALRTMGLEPARYLALPRIVALLVVTPMLTLLGDLLGVVGGAAVAAVSLGVGPYAYLAELRTAVVPGDVLGGLLKGAAFGFAIAVIGCHQGFATTGGAAGVGRRTTAAVVTSLFGIVVIDTLFTMLFRWVGV